MPFGNPIVGGEENLIRRAIRSPNYVTGVSGWTINRDGTAEFQDVTIRGNIDAGSISSTTIGDSTIVNSSFDGGTITESLITFDDSGGLLLLYASAVTTSTINSGSGNYVVPAGITSLKVECWGGGGSGGVPPILNGGGGGGGGEYAAEYTLSVTPAETLTYTVGAGSTTTADGGDTFVQRSGTDLVRANGGGTTNGTAPASGGTGSTNSVRFDGGNGGSRNGASGGGGGSSGGTSSIGSKGGNATPTTGGTGGSVTGGGSGGNGGNAGGGSGINGVAPGGAGGGAGSLSGIAGDGANGRIIISYLSTQTLIGAIAPSAGTDSLGNNYPQGISGIDTGNDYVALDANGELVFGADGAAADLRLYRNNSTTFEINAALRSVRANAADASFASIVTGDSTNRFLVDADGTIEWGPGNATRDVNLFRGGANILRTSDAFEAADVDSAGFSVPRGVLAVASNNAVQSNTNTTEVKDTGVGDLAFTAVSGRRYRVTYRVRCISDATATTMDVRIRDGGGSSPTSGSTQLTGGSIYLTAAGGAGSSNMTIIDYYDCPANIAAGTHTIAGFYLRTAGTGNVAVTNSVGMKRILMAEDVGETI